MRVELQIGAIRYVDVGEAERLVTTGNFIEDIPEGLVRVIRERPPPGWKPPVFDLTPDFICEDVFQKRIKARERLDARQQHAANYVDGSCTCGAGDDWCDYCRTHCVECGLPRSAHPIYDVTKDAVHRIHEFVSVQGELFEEMT